MIVPLKMITTLLLNVQYGTDSHLTKSCNRQSCNREGSKQGRIALQNLDIHIFLSVAAFQTYNIIEMGVANDM